VVVAHHGTGSAPLLANAAARSTSIVAERPSSVWHALAQSATTSAATP
jgi:hypothetical protein